MNASAAVQTSVPLTAARRQQKETSKDERRKIARIQELENKIAALEKQLAELGTQLENPPSQPAEVMRLSHEYARIQKEMDEKLGEWEKL